MLLLLPTLLGQQHVAIGGHARQQQGEWVVVSVQPESVAQRAGLRVGDVVVALDGRPPDTRRRTDPGLDFSGATQWTVLRQDEQLTLQPDWEAVPSHLRAEPFLMLLLAVAFWALAAFVRSRPEQEVSATPFYWLHLAIAAVLAFSPAVSNDVVWAKLLNVLAFSLLPALFLHFCLAFAHRAAPSGAGAWLVRGLYASGAVAGALYLVAGFSGAASYDSARAVLLALLALGLLGGLAVFVHAYVHEWQPGVRQWLHVVLAGVAIAVLPLSLLSLVPESLGQAPLAPTAGSA